MAQLTAETCADYITTAVETPFGSWFQYRAYKWGAKSEGGLRAFALASNGETHYAEVEVRHIDGDTGEVAGEWRKVTPADIRKGIEQWREQQDLTWGRVCEDFDAIDADGAMQLLVLGEVIYG